MTPKNRENQTEKNNGPIGVLASGGSDSSILLAELARRYFPVVPIYIRNGLVWETAELYWLRRFIRAVEEPSIAPVQVLELPMRDVYGTHWSLTGTAVPDFSSEWEEVYLPGRNLILLSKTAVYCAMNGIPAVALGPLKTNLFADSSPDFFSGFQRVAERALTRRFEILTPFSHLTKREVMERGRSLPLELTFSCLKPKGKAHCGKCNKCAERMAAFREAGLKDRTRYRDSARIKGKTASLPAG